MPQPIHFYKAAMALTFEPSASPSFHLLSYSFGNLYYFVFSGGNLFVEWKVYNVRTSACHHSSFSSPSPDMTGSYAPSHGYWIPPHLTLATPASTIIPTPLTTPIVPTMPM